MGSSRRLCEQTLSQIHTAILKQVSFARIVDMISPHHQEYALLVQQRSSCSRPPAISHCRASPASARQVRVSGDRRTNEKTRKYHCIKPPFRDRGLKVVNIKRVNLPVYRRVER